MIFLQRWPTVFCRYTEVATGAVLQKKVFLKILQNSQENNCARVSSLIKPSGPQLS